MMPRPSLHVCLLVCAPILALGACIAEVEPDVGALRAGTCASKDSDPARASAFKTDVLPLVQRPGSQRGST